MIRQPLEQIIADKWDLSENSIWMLVSVVLDYTDAEHDRFDVVNGIKAVMANKPHDFGDEFTERVQEARSFTRADGSGIFDTNKEKAL